MCEAADEREREGGNSFNGAHEIASLTPTSTQHAVILVNNVWMACCRQLGGGWGGGVSNRFGRLLYWMAELGDANAREEEQCSDRHHIPDASVFRLFEWISFPTPRQLLPWQMVVLLHVRDRLVCRKWCSASKRVDMLSRQFDCSVRSTVRGCVLFRYSSHRYCILIMNNETAFTVIGCHTVSLLPQWFCSGCISNTPLSHPSPTNCSRSV